MKRREFMGATAAAAFAMSGPRSVALERENRYRKEIGIQLYTLRDDIKKDVKTTMQAVADAGYQQDEPFGFPIAMPMVMAAEEVGLDINSAHLFSDSILNPNDKSL